MPNSKAIFGKNEVVFTLLRYLTYGFLTVRGFVLAFFLGPYFLGIYGYLMLYQQYLSYSNLGINYSVNSELAILGDNQKNERKKVINSAFSGIFFIALILFFISILIYFLKIDLFPFKNSYKYIFIIVILTILTHCQQIFVNIFRIDKKLKAIIIGELVLSISLLIVAVFFKGVELVNAIFYIWAVLLFLVILYYKFVYEEKISFDTSRIKLLLKLGLPLLVYAFSYYLMSLMVRTLIGAFYPTEVMGYFSFANNITTAIMLGLDTITWVIFPSMIAKMSDKELDKNDLCSYLVTFTNKLIVLVLCLVSFSIISLPILFKILPQYKSIEYSLIILLINQIVFNSGFVFTTLCIARKMHKQMAIFSLMSVMISTVLSLGFCFYKLSYIWLVVSNVIGSLCFINILLYFISKKFEISINKLRQTFNWGMQILFILIVVASIMESYFSILLLLFSMFLLKLNSVKELFNQLIFVFIKKAN
jgi:O-antigen/teichoic acid export membrane protein